MTKRVVFPPPTTQFSPFQKALFDDASKRVVLCCSRASGKTFILLVKLIKVVLELYKERSDATYERSGHIARAAYITPTKNNLVDAFNEFTFLMQQCFDSSLYSIRGTGEDKTVTIFSQSRGIIIRFCSAHNNNAIRGRTLDLCILDEFAYFGQRVSQGRPLNIANPSDGENFLISVILPCLTRPFTDGRLIVSSTPNYGNYFDRMFTSAATHSGLYSDWKLYHVTYAENPFLTAEQRHEIEKIRDVTPNKFKVEYLAEPNVIFRDETREKDRAFQDELLEKCITNQIVWQVAPKYGMAIDIAWQGADKCWFMVLDITSKVIVHLQVYDKTDAEFIVRNLLALKNLFNVSARHICVDTTGKGKQILPLLSQSLKDSMQKVEFNGVRKSAMYGNLVIRLGMDLKIPDSETYPVATLPHATDFPDQSQIANFDLLKRQMYDFYREDFTRIINGAEVPVSRWIQSSLYGDDGCDALAMVSMLLPAIKLHVEHQEDKNNRIKFGSGRISLRR